MRISNREVFTAFGLALLAFLGTNSLLGLLALVVFAVGRWLLWRPGLSPIFIFIFGYQWLQASTKIFQGKLQGLTIEDLSYFGGDVSTATVLSLVGLIALAFGMRFGLGYAIAGDTREIDDELKHKPPMFWFQCYAFALVIALIIQSFAYSIPTLSQPLLALVALRWAFFWVLTHEAFSRAGPVRGLWMLAFVFEFALGLGGYFSSFKYVVFFTMFGVLSSRIRFTVFRLLGLGLLAGLTLMLGITWTAIKLEHRSFLNQGQQAQVVSVSYFESLSNIAQLVQKLDAFAISEATVNMADRLSYVDFFGLVLTRVPKVIPYEMGSLWGDAIIRPFTPRILFSGKSAVHDSERTIYYSGRRVGTAEEGTSISLGYMAESYIDFGPWMMMLPIFALGWMLGRFYQWMVNYPRSRGVIGIGLASAAIFPAAFLESSITKMFGGLVVAMLMSWFIARWIVPEFYSPPHQVC